MGVTSTWVGTKQALFVSGKVTSSAQSFRHSRGTVRMLAVGGCKHTELSHNGREM